MQKKHQIFISSTFADLKQERQSAVEATLAAGHIPAGMELFAAGDESQMAVIERWIDDSDIYMLILGARYGSINPTSGISYTEHEYDYALSKGKPFFALVLSENALKVKKVELGDQYIDRENLEKYDKFREKVLSKISKLVDDYKDVKIGVMESIRQLENKYSLDGWIRTDELPDVKPLLQQLSALSAENKDLSKQIAELPRVSLDGGKTELAELNELIEIKAKYKSSYKQEGKYDFEVSISWSDLFGLIAPILLSGKTDSYMQSYIARQILESKGKVCYEGNIIEQDFNTIKIHLLALNLISVTYSATIKGDTAALFWNLTPSGKKMILSLRSVKKIQKDQQD